MAGPPGLDGEDGARGFLLVACATAAALLPFVGKALHIDDPVYVWIAQHVQGHPLDFYGFRVNWHGTTQAMAEINKNPPLASFYLAGAAALVGWSEKALHAAMLLPALGLAWGVQALVGLLAPGRSARLPLALLLLTLPVFMVSATTVMADVLATALWCWAVVLWLRGFDARRPGSLFGAGLLVAACALTKYVGVFLLPLLAAHALARGRRLGAWLAALALPLALLVGFDLWMRELYGVAPFTGVASYAAGYRPAGLQPVQQGLVGLSFLGGGFLGLAFLLPWLWARRAAWGWLGLLGLLVLACSRLETAGTLSLRQEDGGVRWAPVVQLAGFAWAGLHLLALGGRDALRHRDSASWLLGLWLLGIFVFAAFLNWTTNARAFLPAAPAAILLVARSLPDGRAPSARPSGIGWLAAAAAGLVLSWAVAWADLRLAGSARTAARELADRHRPEEGTLWFLGSWGFQHYMQAEGATRLDLGDAQLLPGDVVVIATNNSTGGMLPRGILALRERAEFPAAPWIATLAPPLGAGFYSDLWGPLPFALGPAPAETYLVTEVQTPVRLRHSRQLPDPAD